MSTFKAPVRVEVIDRASQVEIRNSNYQVMGSGFGSVEMELPVGIYKARTQVGSMMQEQLFAVEEGAAPLLLMLEPVVFSSPAPLQYTNTHHEYHEAALAEALGAPIPGSLTYGNGSRFLLSVRDPSNAPFNQSDESIERYTRSFRGFTLCRAEGDELIDYDQMALRDMSLGYLICHVELDPGHYVLKVAREGFEPLALPVITVMGWVSEVFILMEKVDSSVEAAFTPQMKDIAVMMKPIWENYFQPDDHFFRLTEVARQALQGGRNILDQSLMDDLLNSKFGNPVLGLLSAHLLLLESKPRLDLLGIVIDNLAGLLGYDFPDVVALQHRLMQLAPDLAPQVNPDIMIDFPPLLRVSWDIAADVATENESFFPADSVCWQVADRMTDNGIWTAWRPRPEQVKSQAAWVDLSDEVLLSKKSRDRERIFSMNNAGHDKYVTVGRELLQAAKHLSKPVVREKLRQFIKSAVSKEERPDDLMHELVIRLVEHYSWPDIVQKLAELDVNGDISNRLSSVQKSLIPALMMFRQQLDNGQSIAPDSWKQLIASLKLPKRLLLENLGELARFVASMEVSIADDKIAKYTAESNETHTDQKIRKLDDVVRGVAGIGLEAAKDLLLKKALQVRTDKSQEE